MLLKKRLDCQNKPKVATMSDMKCPFCQQKAYITEWESANSEAYCPNCDTTGDLKLWQELIRTRKALDVAKYALKNIQEDMKERKDGDDIWEIQKNLHDYCKTTINEITALEQKDVK